MSEDVIGVLPSDYPIFDWNDWPKSYAALVSGGLVSEFQKATWNAIVDTLNSALTAAGYQWSEKYTTKEGAKVGSEGYLYARSFNSVRHNIDIPLKLGWAWAKSKEFRGYVGREDFYGHTTHKSESDGLYPEYILELVRKLNLLIELLKGSADTSNMNSDGNALSTAEIEIAKLITHPMQSPGVSYSCLDEVSKIEFAIAIPILSETSTIYELKIESVDPRFDKPFSIIPSIKLHSYTPVVYAFKIRDVDGPQDTPGDVGGGGGTPGFVSTKSVYINSSTSLSAMLVLGNKNYNEPLDGKWCTSSKSATMYSYSDSTIKFELMSYKIPSGVNGSPGSMPGFDTSQGTNLDMVNMQCLVQFVNSDVGHCLSSSLKTDADSKSGFDCAGFSEVLHLYASEIIESSFDQTPVDPNHKPGLDLLAPIDLTSNTTILYADEFKLGFVWYPPEWVNDDGWLFHQVYDYNYDEETGILEVI